MLHTINSPNLNQRLQHLEMLHDIYHRIAEIDEITAEQVTILQHLRQETTLSEDSQVMIDRIFYHLRRKKRGQQSRYCSAPWVTASPA